MPGSKVLLVEGRDDILVVQNLYEKHSAIPIPAIEDRGGVQELLESIPAQLKASNEEGDIVGVIVDADADPQGRWQSLRDRFTSAGYLDVPRHPTRQGIILKPPAESLLPRAGVWIMPDNESPGALEDFLRSLVPQPNPLFDRAIDCVASIPDGERRFGADESKAVMHTWLAWQEEPGNPYGTAIAAGFLDPNAPQARALISWLERLFREPR